MSNPYIQYYNNQIGSGLAAFQGVRVQRGHGFFGRLLGGIGNFIKALAPNLLKAAMPSAIGFSQDLIEGNDIGNSAKSRLLEAGKSAAGTTLDHIKSKIQKGSGIPRTKRKRKTFMGFLSVNTNSKTKAKKLKNTKKVNNRRKRK